MTYIGRKAIFILAFVALGAGQLVVAAPFAAAPSAAAIAPVGQVSAVENISKEKIVAPVKPHKAGVATRRYRRSKALRAPGLRQGLYRELRGMYRRYHRAIRSCYSRAVRGSSSPDRKTEVELLVDPNGTVKRVSFKPVSLNTDLQQCLGTWLRRFSFSAHPEVATVSFPLIFHGF